MSWREPTEADLLEKISGAELRAYRKVVLGDDQDDPVDDQISTTVEMVRGYLAVKYQLGTAGTLPEACIGPAMSLSAVDVIKRIPGRAIDDARAEAARDAKAFFADIAAGKIAVEAPDVATTENFSTPTPSVGTRTRNFSNTNQDGI